MLPGLVYQGACAQACGNAVAMNGWNSHAQHALHRHSVATVAPIVEEAASTGPLAIVKICGMYIVFTLKLCFKVCELNALWFLCVSFGFCDFADHT